jgi:hypothetical protein
MYGLGKREMIEGKVNVETLKSKNLSFLIFIEFFMFCEEFQSFSSIFIEF